MTERQAERLIAAVKNLAFVIAREGVAMALVLLGVITAITRLHH